MEGHAYETGMGALILSCLMGAVIAIVALYRHLYVGYRMAHIKIKRWRRRRVLQSQ